MALSQTDLDNLSRAIVGAELEVEYEGRRVKFRSVSELRAAYEHAKSELAAQAASNGGGRSQFRYQFTTQRD